MSVSMSRGKLRNVQECADCGSSDPSWASVNRGILLCDECCSIHRSLGRHISQVKSLKKGSWSPTLLHMVHTLNNNGVNSVWEHSLLDPAHSKSGRRKPHCKDPLHPTKADFIRAKHQMLAFVFRPGKDDTLLLEDDLSRQLHSSVRTSNLETSLRLLSQGADPNYFHEEKGTTPLHVAAKAGQVSQAELLVVYGADPGAEDNQGKTPVEYARLSGHRNLSDRLVECAYELTDRFAYYLCSRKPDHQIGQHYIVPEMSDSLDLTEFAKDAKKKLQQLPNHLFEELAMDVYDEVDRRETESIWLSTLKSSSIVAPERCTVPFLPVNPEFSSTRNQGRQKLARFNAREFATLIIDILSDAKRRQSPTAPSLLLSQVSSEIKGPQVNKVPGSPLSVAVDVHQPGRKSEISDDEPLYDSVASDEDYIAAEQMAVLAQQAANMRLQDSKSETPERVEEKTVHEKKEPTPASIDKQSGPLRDKHEDRKLNSVQNGGITSIEENIKRQLAASENEMGDLRSEIQILQSTVQNLVRENSELRTIIQHAGLSLPHPSSSSLCSSSIPNGCETETEPVLDVKSPRSSVQRPASMYEPREGLLLRSGSQSPHIHHYVSATGNIGKWDKNQKRDPIVNEYDSPSTLVRPVMTQSLYRCSSPSQDGLTSTSSVLPLAEEVVRRTDQVTKCIQELWASMQDLEGRDTFIPCAERIRVAVAELSAIFPQNPLDETIRSALRQMNNNTLRLQSECAGLQRCAGNATQFSEQAYFLQQVRSCAYDIAKATKQLVTKFQY
ncbi:ARF GTPase-activating protein GIT2 [Zootermopsis nevadensis]|uniref:ARF GTPase-activating protein GIT2 n=1 Tax=Zootermopsis nevadensis TaxID=136037 RepID=A0A067R4N6_ZOONE|nr:ARF GTPase-activating protein GIT2 [Zootermopsis nevadensis]KDR18062.1 ARF GTPase-activating protein GIT2 [Zootermopsis nevadensis]